MSVSHIIFSLRHIKLLWAYHKSQGNGLEGIGLCDPYPKRAEQNRVFLAVARSKIAARSGDSSVSHRNGFRAEYSGRNLSEYSAETVSVKIMGFGDERNIR